MITSQGELELNEPGIDAELISRLFARCDRILVKKLSNNDRDWARFSNKHQAGVYIPHEQRDSGFFPVLDIKVRCNPDDNEIRECFFTTVWPQLGNEEKKTRLVHYTSKGQETHLTGLPKVCFAELLPASFLIVGRSKTEGQHRYECLSVDSASEEAELLAEMLDMETNFLINIYEPATLKDKERERVLDFADRAIAAWLDGKIDTFSKENASMPSTVDLARMARESFLREYRIEKINPFNMAAPGDALREISRSIEWDMFRQFQHRERSIDLIRTILGDEPKGVSAADVIRALIDQFQAVDALMLSSSQQRKSRAGHSYEHHIEAMLSDGDIPFEKQVIISSRKRPDFILPSLAVFENAGKKFQPGLILSAKTTLRERWKQVEREKGKQDLFLTTVDENVAGNAIEDMASFGVYLVIPESLKVSKTSEYEGQKNVLSFKEFIENIIKSRMATWAPLTSIT